MAFNVSLGNPGSAFSSPSSSVRHQRHRGPADKEKSRQRAAAHQAAAAVGEPKSAAGHQETLGRATSPPVSDPLPSPPARPVKPPLSIPTASTTVPVMTPTFASVTARPEKAFNCDQCTAVLTNEAGLKIHKVNTPCSSATRLLQCVCTKPCTITRRIPAPSMLRHRLSASHVARQWHGQPPGQSPTSTGCMKTAALPVPAFMDSPLAPHSQLHPSVDCEELVLTLYVNSLYWMLSTEI